ncbi:hypothetical protein LAZ67_14003527 [Cordylochernes scorpioides]|uniref:Uncharacterized protein n=1 Tax=Cordylochernes scorpioides TaxID=51811 RepID=A0ABY6LAA7_9ARAC|nr:hypothetical protein LAZ67_14003527 [Cordylochernes scorpioides]
MKPYHDPEVQEQIAQGHVLVILVLTITLCGAISLQKRRQNLCGHYLAEAVSIVCPNGVYEPTKRALFPVHLHLRWNLYERKDSTASHYPDNHETFRESFGALVNPIIRDLIASFDVTDLPDSIAIRHIHPCFVQCCSIFRSGTGQVFLVELPDIRCTVFHVERGELVNLPFSSGIQFQIFVNDVIYRF